MRAFFTAVAVVTACLAGAAAAGGQETGGFEVGMGLDRDAGKRADQMYGASRLRGMTRFSVRWKSGVIGRVRRSVESQVFADYVLTLMDGTRHRGSLRIPAGRAAGRITLQASGPMPVLARLRVGTLPSLVVKGLPAGTTKVEVRTTGSGRDVIRANGPCIRGRRETRASMAVSYANGVTPTTGAGTNFPVDC